MDESVVASQRLRLVDSAIASDHLMSWPFGMMDGSRAPDSSTVGFNLTNNCNTEGRRPCDFRMLMIPRGYEKAAPGTMPDAKAGAAMDQYNESLQKAGVLLSLDGLHPPSMGARVSFSGGKPTVTDGPFLETKELLGGYWMIQVKSKEEAVKWASRCPASDNEIIEIRQVQELSNFPDDLQKAAAKFPEMQAQSKGRKHP